MKRWIIVLMLSSLCLLPCLAWAAEHHSAATPSSATAEDNKPHPALSADPAWVSTMVGVILALFAAAIPVGLIVRANTPQEVAPPPAPAGHDSHHH